MAKLNTIIAICYIALQTSMAIFISIIGAVHVRRCLKEEKNKQCKMEKNIELNTISKDTESKDAESNNTALETEKIENKQEDNPSTLDTNNDIEKHDGCLKLWMKTVWKLRGVYSSFLVHSFDVLTDVLVILQWLDTPNEEGDNIDPQIMAYSAIAIMIFSKTFSAIAILVKDRDIFRSILQFVDLLIFFEIYETHSKIVSQMRNKKLKDENNKSVESTLSFKYIRQLEAIFESVPESVLQLIYVMRTGNIEVIFMISIIQSIVSMTNSILNHDNTRMQDDKWKKYKQRLPPTFQFIKHFIARVAEITYRIGLLSLLWTVCGGLAFSIILALELLIILLRTSYLVSEDELILDADTVLLALNSFVVIPSEEVFLSEKKWHVWGGSNINSGNAITDVPIFCILNLCCCCGLTSFIAALSGMIYECDKDIELGLVPLARINTSFLEFIFLIVYGIFGQNGTRKDFLLSFDHGLSVFIATCIFYLIYTQYILLFPNFSLPLGVSARSKWGYAYSAEIGELKKITLPKFPYK
eukprot:195507_1